MDQGIKRYSNGEITVLWHAAKCMHSGVCTHGLPAVFDPQKKPWITIGAATSDAIVAQVARCPSGALSIAPAEAEPASTGGGSAAAVEVRPDGPLMISGQFTLTHRDGRTERCEGTTAFCRCGGSANKPFCDGSHKRNGFKA